MEEGKRLKRFSTSTDVEAAANKGTKPLLEAERELQKNSETPIRKAKRKKQKMTSEIKEMKKLRKSFKEMTQSVKKLHETAGLPVISFKEKETTPEKRHEEDLATYECCFESKESAVIDRRENTIFVRGFDPSLPRDDIKTALRTLFGTCGLVTRVFVPIECKTGATLGYAFVDMQSDADKALKLRGSSLGGWSLEVMMAKDTLELFSGLANLRGCERCSVILRSRIAKRFIVTNGGRCLKTNFKLPMLKTN